MYASPSELVKQAYMYDNFTCFVDTGGIRTPLSQCKCDVLAFTLPGPFKHNKFKELCAIGGIEPNPYLTPIHIHCLELYTFG